MCSLLQGWSDTTLSPLSALMVLFAYERQTGQTLTDKQLTDGSLANLLTEEDYKAAGDVSTYFTLIPKQFHH